jgi:small subunit ribosomal protein S18
MARNSKTPSKKKPGPRPASADGKARVRRGRPKVCQFCATHADWVDYKDINTLRRFVNDRGRIRSRSATGTCRQHQRDVAVAIKTARELALLPYSLRTSATGPGERRAGTRRDRPAQAGSADEGAESTAAGAAEVDAVSDGTDPQALMKTDLLTREEEPVAVS